MTAKRLGRRLPTVVRRFPSTGGLGRADLQSRSLPAPAAAAAAFLAGRAAVWVVAILVTLVVPADRALERAGGGAVSSGVGHMFDLWARWDSVWFVRIAEHGYARPPEAAAFSPLYPGLLAAGGRLAGGRYVLAGIAFSLVCAAAAAALLYRLGSELLDEGAARRAVLYLAFFPMSFFLGAVYGESLYLLLALGAFVSAEHGRFGTAGLAAGLAILTRGAGVALLPAIALLALRAPSPRRALAGLALALPVAAAAPLVLLAAGRSPLDVLRAQELWQRHLSPAGPFGGVVAGAVKGWRAALSLGSPHGAYLPWPSELANLLFLMLFLALTVVAWRRLGAPYGLFAALSLALPLSVPSTPSPLLSLPRFGLVVFPFFLALATLGRRPRVNGAILAFSGCGLVLALAAWTSWHWVA